MLAISSVVMRSHSKPWIGSGSSVELQPFSKRMPPMSRWRPEKASWTMYLQSCSWTRPTSSRQNGIVSSRSMCA